MSTDSVSHIVVVGRDAPVWLAACVMQSALGPAGVNVTVVELPSALRVHDVYATLPALEALHHRLRIDEATLLGSTGGAFSLGQNFADTSGATPPFFHAYGSYGAPIDNKAFLPYWLMARSFGLQVALDDFSLTAAAAKHGRMLIPDTATETYGRTDYGYHLPGIEYARVLKNAALRRGVNVHTAHAVGALLDPDDGSVVALQAAGGLRVAGEFFIDASGTESWLLGSVLGVQRDSWRQSFPVDRQLVSSGDRLAIIPPYADVRAGADGWLGLYPVQTRTHVAQSYSSALCTDEHALQLAATGSGLRLADATVKRSEPGRSAVAWEKNCIAIGDAACAFDPVHAVDLQALQIGLVHLLSLFPAHAEYRTERTQYNQVMRQSFERIRDFQSAHYALSRYAHSAFWDLARSVAVSAELAHKIDTFRARGEMPWYENESFAVDSWQALFIGHGVIPETHDPIIDRTSPEVVKHEFRRILAFIKDKVQEQTTHGFYLQTVCAGSRR